MTTTLKEIKAKFPCDENWEEFLKKLDDVPLELLDILESSDLDTALWVLNNVIKDTRLIRHFIAWCVEKVLYLYEDKYPHDGRVRNQIKTLRDDTMPINLRMRDYFEVDLAMRQIEREGNHLKSDAWQVAQASLGGDTRYASWVASREVSPGEQADQLRKIANQINTTNHNQP